MRSLMFLIGLLSMPGIAFATYGDPCYFFESNCGAVNAIASAVPFIANFFIALGAGVSVVFVIAGAMQMLLSGFDESMLARGKMSVVYALAGLLIVSLSQTLVAYVISQSDSVGLSGSSQPVIGIMTIAVNAMLGIFGGVFVLVIIFAGFRMVYARGVADEFNKAKSALTWAIVGAIVVSITYALVQAVIAI
ncbi:hypothetical protein A3J91_05720 [Candidatus Peribacteria bacterium RIFOXYC2_FULL_58_10]|nr:MAG: hypothetical protein A3J91_05720 [Candidatus Peribacteria bacterium RIFOXYC2_FULL_58_10]